jgi:hypothetical protein
MAWIPISVNKSLREIRAGRLQNTGAGTEKSPGSRIFPGISLKCFFQRGIMRKIRSSLLLTRYRIPENCDEKREVL